MSQWARVLARIIFGHEALARRLERSAFVQGLAQRLHLREWINAALARHPIRRSRGGVKYQIETFEALSVEKMYFGDPAYTEIFASQPPETFIDLGCNSGIFACFLAHLAEGRPLRGLCVDANAAQVELARKSAQANGWTEIYFRHGLVGSCSDQLKETEFFLHPTSLGSSQFAYTDSESGRPPDWKRIMVPTLKVGELWTQLFGPDLRCACLKIDIEGSEMHFLHQEPALLTRVDSVLLEWHVWGTTRDEVTQFLSGLGFILERKIEDAPRHGVLFFRRS